MGILVTQVLKEINEALEYEKQGAEIDLVCKDAHLRKDLKEEMLWMLFLNHVARGVTICLGFYTDQVGDFMFPVAMQNGQYHELTKEEQDVCEEAFEWLKDNKRITNG